MSVAQVDANSIYTQINVEYVNIREHAIDQAIVRFNLESKQRNDVEDWIRDKLKNSKFKSMLNSLRYGVGRLYECDGVALVLDPYQDTVLTVYMAEMELEHKLHRYMIKDCKRINYTHTRKQRKQKRLLAQHNLKQSQM